MWVRLGSNFQKGKLGYLWSVFKVRDIKVSQWQGWEIFSRPLKHLTSHDFYFVCVTFALLHMCVTFAMLRYIYSRNITPHCKCYWSIFPPSSRSPFSISTYSDWFATGVNSDRLVLHYKSVLPNLRGCHHSNASENPATLLICDMNTTKKRWTLRQEYTCCLVCGFLSDLGTTELFL